jgi:excisionase family DNA binding protein
MDEVGYLTLTEAARRLGVSRWTLYRRIDDGALSVYRSDRDRRVKLVKRADVEALATPQIASRETASEKGKQCNA